jgi:hypothetical protein
MGGGGGGQQPLFKNPPTGTGLANPNANVGPNAGPPNAGPPNAGMPQQSPQPPQTQPQLGQPEPEPNIPEQDIARFQEIYRSLPPGREKDAAAHALANSVKRILPNGGVHEDQGQVTTPEELADIRQKNKAAEVTATEQAKAEVSRVEEGKRITNAFKAAMGEGGVSRVMKLISESTSGPTEKFGADVAARIPQSGGAKTTTGMEKIGRLTTIAKELAKTIERSPGAQSDKDVAINALASAAIDDPSIAYNQRMQGFLEFTRIIKEKADALGINPKEIGIDVDTETGSNIPTANTDEEAEQLVKTLKPGQSFIGPDGKTHKIKGM